MEEKQSKAEVNQVYAAKEFTPSRIVCVAVTTFYCSMWAKKLTQKEMMGEMLITIFPFVWMC